MDWQHDEAKQAMQNEFQEQGARNHQRAWLTSAAREWIVLALTVLLVPGGIVVALALFARNWNRRRALKPVAISAGVAVRA